MSTSPLACLESTEIWAATVAAQADFPDERLNTRYGLILRTLADKPLDSFPQACAKPSQAQAVYRFLENKRIDVNCFLQPLVNATVDACRSQEVILAIQDSSSANYASLTHTSGLGKLNDSDALGLHFHTTVAVRGNGLVCGLLHQSFWIRPPQRPPVAGERKDKPIDAKESYKWLEGIEAAEAAIEQLPPSERPRLVHLFDREGDIHEALERISASPHGAVIRVAQTQRCLAEPHDKVYQAIAQRPCWAPKCSTFRRGRASRHAGPSSNSARSRSPSGPTRASTQTARPSPGLWSRPRRSTRRPASSLCVGCCGPPKPLIPSPKSR